MEAYNLISLAGLGLLVGLGWLLSENRRRVNWRVLFWGLGLQLGLALIIFVFPVGARLFWAVNDGVVAVLDSASAGARFVFGRLAVPPGVTEEGETSVGFILAFQAFPTIIFFSALVAVLYYVGIMTRVMKWFAALFTRLMRLSGAESLSAASNIFVGVESALTVRPYLAGMTRSELCTVLTAGMATVSSNVLAVYVFSLREQFPAIGGHMVLASFLSAPAALAASKLLVPETDEPLTLGKVVSPQYVREQNLFEAIIQGAHAGVRLVVGIVALLLAILGLVALADWAVGGAGQAINRAFGLGIDWSLSGLLGYLFYPLALICGVPASDAPLAARIIGERAVVTELTSYLHLNAALAEGALHHARSAVIIAYALCGFAHLASLAIFVGGISALAPSQTVALTRVGFRALIAATLACLMTACIAGTFYRHGALFLSAGGP